MSRYFVTHQSVSLSCGLLTVNMTTNSTQHLWLLATTTEPRIIPRRDRRLNNTVPHQNNHTLFIEYVIEQEEAGNTLQHTFTLQWPAGATILFFYSINMGTTTLKATRSAIYAYELEAKALLGETWSNNRSPDLPWVFSDTPPDPPPPCINGNVWIYGNNFENRSAVLDLTPFLGTTPNDFCNKFLTIKLGGFTSVHATAGLDIQVAIIFRNALAQECARTLAYSYPTPPCQQLLPNIVGLISPHTTARLNFDLAYTNSTGLCHAGMDPPIPDPFPAELRLLVGAPAFSLPMLEWHFNFGSMFLSDSSGQLRDVSKYWRTKRPSPKLP